MITYLIGDATRPSGKILGNKIIAHICNDIGVWGRGFVLSVSENWPSPHDRYKEWHKTGKSKTGKEFRLGEVQLVKVENDVFIANMIAQHDIYTKDKIPPIRYDALKECLDKLASYAAMLDATIHLPRIGCGLAGGEWIIVEELILNNLINNPKFSASRKVFVYDLPS